MLVPQDQTNWVVLAHLLRPQGRKGEVLAELLSDFPERFKSRLKVSLAAPDFHGLASEAMSLEIVSSWLPHGRNEGRIVLGFSGVDSIEGAEGLAGLDVLVPETDRVELADGGVYIDELIGCTLFDGAVPVGTIRDVEFMTTADGRRRLADTAPLLTVDTPAGEALIPFAKDFLVSMDLGGRRVLMKLPEGLVDVNLKPEPKSD